MKRSAAMLALVLAAQGVLADPSVPDAISASPSSETAEAVVAAKLAEADLRMQALAERKVRRSVEEAVGHSAGGKEDRSAVVIELSMVD
ncbi:MAG: hypothetical protein CALGDGBN_01042 [Pseudomonadales bacterium]|nr:hypothetical protein [Pseudomonadales bacterium]